MAKKATKSAHSSPARGQKFKYADEHGAALGRPSLKTLLSGVKKLIAKIPMSSRGRGIRSKK
jgi:hypothetical protein